MIIFRPFQEMDAAESTEQAQQALHLPAEITGAQEMNGQVHHHCQLCVIAWIYVLLHLSKRPSDG